MTNQRQDLVALLNALAALSLDLGEVLPDLEALPQPITSRALTTISTTVGTLRELCEAVAEAGPREPGVVAE